MPRRDLVALQPLPAWKSTTVVLSLLLCSLARADGLGHSEERTVEDVRAVVLEKEYVLRWLADEVGQGVLRGAIDAGGTCYLFGEDRLREVGRLQVTFETEAAALALYRVATRRANFRTKKNLTVYEVAANGSGVIVHFRQGVEPVANGLGQCDLECQFGVVEARHRLAGEGIGP